MLELVRQGNRLTQVRTAAGDLEADTVVLAAGAWTTALARLDRRLDADGARQGLQLHDPPDRRPDARDPALRRPRRLHALQRSRAHRRHDGVQRHQQPPRPAADRRDRGGRQADARCRGRRPRSRTSGRACGRSPPTGCRSSTAPGRSTTPTSPPGTRCRASRWRRPPGSALAEMIATGRRPPLLEPFRLDRFGRVRLPARRAPAQAPWEPRDEAARGDHRHRQHRHRPDDEDRPQPVAGARGHGRHRSGVGRTAHGARARRHRLLPTGLRALLELVDDIDLAFDATSARAHAEHARLLAERGIRSVDLTPAALGPAVVPPVNLREHAGAGEVNLITCGAQATIPIVAAVSARRATSSTPRPSRPSRRARPGRARAQNIDEFTTSTARALETVGGARAAKAIIILNPADPPILMRNTIYLEVAEPDRRGDRDGDRALRWRGSRRTCPATA